MRSTSVVPGRDSSHRGGRIRLVPGGQCAASAGRPRRRPRSPAAAASRRSPWRLFRTPTHRPSIPRSRSTRAPWPSRPRRAAREPPAAEKPVVTTTTRRVTKKSAKKPAEKPAVEVSESFSRPRPRRAVGRRPVRESASSERGGEHGAREERRSRAACSRPDHRDSRRGDQVREENGRGRLVHRRFRRGRSVRGHHHVPAPERQEAGLDRAAARRPLPGPGAFTVTRP